jgi:ABC-type amino acid transport system permease subunit
MISEPMTLATDYLLAAVTGVLALRLLHGSAKQNSRRFWGVAFVALALGAALGGTHHGFQLQALWKPTVWVIGVAAWAMISGSAIATTRGHARQALLAFALVELAAFWLWTWRDDRFMWVVADTASAFALVALLHALRLRDPASPWIIGGVALSGAAAAVQAGGVDLHRHFNHNDLYHVIQIAAMLLYYGGARRLVDNQNQGATP